MSETTASKAADYNTLFDFKGKAPRAAELIPLSLQHVLAAVVGVVTPAIIVAGTCNMNAEDTTMMI